MSAEDNSQNYWLFISVAPCRRRSSSKSQIFSLHHRAALSSWARRLVCEMIFFTPVDDEKQYISPLGLVMENKMSSILKTSLPSFPYMWISNRIVNGIHFSYTSFASWTSSIQKWNFWFSWTRHHYSLKGWAELKFVATASRVTFLSVG